MNNLHKAAITVFSRKQRFMINYNIDSHIFDLYNKYFGDIKILNRDGLNIQYNKLKDQVINEKLIGLILYGNSLETTNIKNRYINIYIRPKNKKTITLSVKGISEYLLNDYFNESIINKLCRETPNINLYYKDH
jgi:hypothetical protein